MNTKTIVFVTIALFFFFSVFSVVLANGEHASGEEHDDHEIARTEGIRWPVLAGGAIAILVVAVLAYKFIVK